MSLNSWKHYRAKEVKNGNKKCVCEIVMVTCMEAGNCNRYLFRKSEDCTVERKKNIVTDREMVVEISKGEDVRAAIYWESFLKSKTRGSYKDSFSSI